MKIDVWVALKTIYIYNKKKGITHANNKCNDRWYLPFDCGDIYVDDLYPVVDSLLWGIWYKKDVQKWQTIPLHKVFSVVSSVCWIVNSLFKITIQFEAWKINRYNNSVWNLRLRYILG